MNDQNPQDPEAAPEFAHYGVASSDLSHVIIAFAKPMLEQCESYDRREEAISYAILVWNLSLESVAEQERLRHDIENQIPEQSRVQIHALFDYLIKRKQELYADNRFYILEYTLTPMDDGMRIEMSTRYVPRS